MAQGALPASFAVSGRQAKVAADEISGDGFALYPAVVTSVDGRPAGNLGDSVIGLIIGMIVGVVIYGFSFTIGQNLIHPASPRH